MDCTAAARGILRAIKVCGYSIFRASCALFPIVSQKRSQAGRRCYVDRVAELARIPARELAQYRQRNEIPVRSALYFGVPAGFAIDSPTPVWIICW